MGAADSVREQRERLARARRERERTARANLAAKARGETAGADVAEAGSDEEKPESGAGAAPSKPEAAKPKPAKPKASSRAKEKAEREDDADDRERDEPKARGRKPRKRSKSRERSKPRGRRGSRESRPAVLAAAGKIATDARSWIVKTAPKAGALVLRAALAFFTAFFAAIGFVLNLAVAAWDFVRGPLRAAVIRLDRATRTASRAITPSRALAVVVAGALILLALSQFADYRSISIGNDSYSPGIQTVAPAPVAETDATGSAHSYLLVPLAGVGLLLLAVAMTGRRRLCGLLALIGLAAVLIALIHDRPVGLDTGNRSLEYEGVKATLVGGFYAQIAAGLALLASSLLLGRELRIAAGARSSSRSPRSTPALPRLRRRKRPRVQGAGA
jgi:hypothetical protein